ncbi:MAG: DUF6171 family protein [Ilumatobacteraceae bacterium]
MSAWQEYKQKLGTTRPWDVLNPNTPKVEDNKYADRIAECASCDRLIRPTFQCKECGCFMKLKARLEGATCPLGKW